MKKMEDLETEHAAAVCVMALTCGMELSSYVMHYAVASYAATKGDFCAMCYDLRPFEFPLV